MRKKQIIQTISDLEKILENSNWDDELREMNQNQKEWMDKVLALIQVKKYEAAKKIFYGILLDADGEINPYWMNTDAAILDYMFKTYNQEKESGNTSIFERISNKIQMKEFYYELKFLIRRFEYDFPEDLKEELLSIIDEYVLSENALIEMIKISTILQEKVLNEMAVFLMKHQRYDYVLPLLLEAQQINPLGQQTLYNLTYFLYALDEKELAKVYFNQIKQENISQDILATIIEKDEQLLPYESIHKMEWEKDEEPASIEIPDKLEKIAFIMCVNNERFYEECCHYIRRLKVPKGYTVEIIPIYGAKSITSGYQTGMEKANAKYNIYLHQDTMCINENMLYEALHIFQKDDEVGMIGVAGTIEMPVSGIWWEAKEDKTYLNLYQDLYIYDVDEKNYDFIDYQRVQALDGVFLMTSKNLDWRTELFNGWHIYDVSQSMEFIRQGYKIVIPKMEKIWVLHCDGYKRYLGLDYHVSRLKYLKEYKEDL